MDNNELISRLAEEAAPVRPAMNPFTLAVLWLAGVAIYTGMALMMVGARPDLPQVWHDPMYGSEILLLVGMIASCAISSALLGYPDMYQRRYLLVSPVVILGLLAGVMYLSWAANPDAPAPEHGFRCTLHITIMSLLPAAAIFYSLGKLASTHQARAGLVALLTAFSTAALIARLSEMTDSITHIVEWHYLPALGFAVVGVLLGKLLLRW